jgi:hypothetical protein
MIKTTLIVVMFTIIVIGYLTHWTLVNAKDLIYSSHESKRNVEYISMSDSQKRKDNKSTRHKSESQSINNKDLYPVISDNFMNNIKHFSQTPVMGTWNLAGGAYGIANKGIIKDDTKLDFVINQYNRYTLNSVLLRYEDMCDDTYDISERGKVFLAKMALGGIRVIINLSDNYGFTSERWKPKEGIEPFLVSLNKFRNKNERAYDNILALFLSSDVSQRRVKNIKTFATYIRNKVYSGIIGRPLDIPLMIKTVREGALVKDNNLDKEIEIIGASNYPFLYKDQERNCNILRKERSQSGVPDERFFTNVQAHNQFWYNAMFYKADVEDSPLDPYPDGVQIASLIYQNLQASVKNYLIFQAPYLKSDTNNFAKDRLAEIGLVNKLILALWEPVIRHAYLNQYNNTDNIKDEMGKFFGDVLNFRDRNGFNGALLVLSNRKANYILGNASGKDVSFELKNIGVILEKANLKVVQVEFPEIKEIPFKVKNNDVLAITVPHIYENACVLVTSDQSVIKEIDHNIKTEQNNAQILIREAFEGRLNKTAKEIKDMETVGFKLDESEQSILSTLINKKNNLDKMSFEESRSAISQIGDFQMLVYRRVHHTSNEPDYPDAKLYRTPFYDEFLGGSTSEIGSLKEFNGKVPQYLASCVPQKFHFYLLSEYLSQCKNRR